MHLIEQAARPAGRVVDSHARLGIEEAGHEAGHLGRGEVLPGGLALAFRELPEQILVGPAQDVRLDVFEAEAVAGEDLDQGGEALVVHDALSGGGGVEVDHVDDALEGRVLSGGGSDGVGQGLAQAGGDGGDGAPAGRLGQVGADGLAVPVSDLQGDVPAAEVVGQPVDLVIEHVGEPLQEDEREDVVLELGGVEGATDLTGCIPQPGLQVGHVEQLCSPYSATRALRLEEGSDALSPVRVWTASLGGLNSRGSGSACLIALLDQRHGTVKVSPGADRDFEVPRTEVADICHIASEPSVSSIRAGIDLDEHQQFPGVGMHFDAGEVLNPLESDVVLEVLLLHIVTRRDELSLEVVIEYMEVRWGASQILVNSLVGRGGLRGAGRSSPRAGSHCVDQFEEDELVAVSSVSNQFNVPIHLSHSVLVVAGEILGDAQEAGTRPIDGVLGVQSKLLDGQNSEFALMVEQPVQIEQALVDHVFRLGPLVLDDHWRVVLVHSERVYAPPMQWAGRVLTGKKTDTEKGFQVLFDEGLELLFQIMRGRYKLGHRPLVDSEELDVAHISPARTAVIVRPSWSRTSDSAMLIEPAFGPTRDRGTAYRPEG